MASHAMTGMGNRLWDQMMTAGVVGDDQVTCMGHGRHDTRYMGEHMEVQQKQSTEVLRSIAGDVSLRLGGGRSPL